MIVIEHTEELTEMQDNSAPRLALTVEEIMAWQPPEGYCLVGEQHVVRESVCLLAGVAGCGKSRAAMALAIAGATGRRQWMGLPVHGAFKTYMLQNENGKLRLKNELSEILQSCTQTERKAVADNIAITPPPEEGLAFSSPGWCSSLKAELEAFKPDLVVLDPWTNATADDSRKDYRAAMEQILQCLPATSCRPALLIVSHTRKPSSGDRPKRGRELLNEIAGSFVLGSRARSAFVMEPASPDSDDNRVVWTNCKNNDGQLAEPTAWHRANGLFTPCLSFDFEEFYKGNESKRKTVTEQDLKDVLRGGKALSKSELVNELMEATECGKSACYNAVKKHKDILTLAGKKYTLNE